MDDIYNNIDDFNSSSKRKILLLFDDMIVDIMNNKKFEVILKNYLLDSEN